MVICWRSSCWPAGEQVVDVPPMLAARVRRWTRAGRTRTTRTMPGRSRSPRCARATLRAVLVEDQSTVLADVGAPARGSRLRPDASCVCRLHAIMCELVPGGFAKKSPLAQALRLLEDRHPRDAIATARHRLAGELVEDICVASTTSAASIRRRLPGAVAASGPVPHRALRGGAVIAATVIGYTGDIGRFPTRDQFAAYNGTAPIECVLGQPSPMLPAVPAREPHLNHAIHIAAVTQIRYPAPVRPHALRPQARRGHTPRQRCAR